MKTTRKTISVKTRFEVFKRDVFTCQYCNAKPPKVPLEVDHIIPVSKGGKNNLDNLITACFDCNRGKSDRLLDNVPESLIIKAEAKRLALSQYKQYLRIVKKETEQMEKDIDEVQEIYQYAKPHRCFSDPFRFSVKKFIKELGIEEVKDSMAYAIQRNRYGDPIKYFCGICWNKIRE